MFVKVVQKIIKHSSISPRPPEFKKLLIPITDIERVEGIKHGGCLIFFKNGKERLEVLESIDYMEASLNLPKYTYMIKEDSVHAPRSLSNFSSNPDQEIEWNIGDEGKDITKYSDFHYVNDLSPMLANQWLVGANRDHTKMSPGDFIIVDVSGIDPSKSYGFFKSIMAIVFDGRFMLYQALRR